MNIYRIWQRENTGYDTYSEAVVIASSLGEAKNIIPGYFYRPEERMGENFISTDYWASSPYYVNVELLGKAVKFFNKPCIITSSFKAG